MAPLVTAPSTNLPSADRRTNAGMRLTLALLLATAHSFVPAPRPRALRRSALAAEAVSEAERLIAEVLHRLEHSDVLTEVPSFFAIGAK